MRASGTTWKWAVWSPGDILSYEWPEQTGDNMQLRDVNSCNMIINARRRDSLSITKHTNRYQHRSRLSPGRELYLLLCTVITICIDPGWPRTGDILEEMSAHWRNECKHKENTHMTFIFPTEFPDFWDPKFCASFNLPETQDLFHRFPNF